MRAALTDIFLALGVVCELIGCIGVLAMRGAYDRLHFSSPGMLGAMFIATAVVIKDSFSLVGDKAILIAVFVLLGSPILTHAVARAARIHEHGDWRIRPGEDVEVEEP